MRNVGVRVLIKKLAPRCLVFEVVDGAGKLLARSLPYTTICKLEAGLSVLSAAAESAHRTEFADDEPTTWVMPAVGRRRVALEGRHGSDALVQLLQGIPQAELVDERPAAERRTDLSGQLCELTH